MPLPNAFLSILLLPLVSFLVLLLGQKFFSTKIVGIIASSITALGLFVLLTSDFSEENISFTWFSFFGHSINLDLLANNYTFSMLLIVHLVALLVQIFSIDYMHHDEGIVRYFAFLQLFIFAMIGIVIAGNLLLMYVFWELVGLASYLLIGFWFQKKAAIRASKKAFIFNRIGDAGFLAGIGLLYFYTQEFAFDANLAVIDQNMATLIGCLLFCGTIGKSAQFPLNVWLPDAMEGPTPVSALIHAATMVAAGVFLLIRIFGILIPDAQLFIAIIGSITMLLGGLSALFQSDIKKLLAFSTISQLGMMVLAIGLGSPEAAFFHLSTHAFFKAGLFLSAGAIIHHLHTQDIYEMGGLKKTMPIVWVVYVVCGAALAGVPLTTGFLSKEILLSVAKSRPMFYGLILFNAMLTAAYMTRQIKLIFFGESKSETAESFSFSRHLPIGLLALASVAFLLTLNPFDAKQSWFWHFFALPAFEHSVVTPIASVLVVLTGFLLGLKLDNLKETKLAIITSNQLMINEFYDKTLVRTTFFIAEFSIKIDQFIDGFIHLISGLQLRLGEFIAKFDEAVIDKLVDGASLLVAKTGRMTSNWQQGTSIVTMLIGFLIIVLIFVLRKIQG